VVIFAHYLVSVDHIVDALEEDGIGVRKFVGRQRMSQAEQDEAIDAFWNDDSMQVLVGTTALERSLNLQKSAYMIAFNQLWNPQRGTQLLGRIRRMGSEHAKVFLINLLTEDTIEERLFRLLSERMALPDFVFDEESDLFEKLGDAQLMMLIQE